MFTTELLAEHAPSLDVARRASGRQPFVLFFEPPSLDDRIVNQSAVLSAMSDPVREHGRVARANPELWHAWLITPEAKAQIRERLDQANITERVLMPGLDGLAAWLRRYYGPLRGAPDAQQEGAAMAGPSALEAGQGDRM